MLNRKRFTEILHEHLEDGDFDPDSISADIAREMRADLSPDVAFAMLAARELSFAILNETEGSGKDRVRKAYVAPNAERQRVIIHRDYPADHNIVRALGQRKIDAGKRQVKEGYTLLAWADQLELDLTFAKAA